MKRKPLLIVFMMMCLFSFAQQKPKPKEADKPPTQKEMEEMMKEMQKEMDNMSPEDKKMMDSMGIKMPSMKDIPKVTDKQLADAWEDENRIVPKRDATRIASIPKQITSARLPAFLTALRKEVTPLLDADATAAADKLYSYLAQRSVKKEDMGNVATYLWTFGKAQIAIHLMSRVCVEAPTINNLSNYASMLSMLGAGHLAIPLLENLNKQIPKNGIILNNLGQAWFDLGEIAKAEKYLDSAVAIFPFHPQANLTKAAISESRGNKTQAIEALKKSIKHTYSKEKEDKLRKLGYNLTLENLSIPFKPSADPLGLNQFRQPDYPKTVSDLKVLLPQWKAFDEDCNRKIAALQKEIDEAGIKYEQQLKVMMTKNIQAINNGGTIGVMRNPLYSKKASLVLEEVANLNEIKMKKLGEKFVALGTELDYLQRNRKKAAPEAPCEAHVNAQNEFLSKWNTLIQSYNNEFLQTFKHFSNDMAYWSQYTSTDKNQYEIIKLGFMIGWLQKLKEYRPLLTAGGLELNSECIEKKDSKPHKLAEWDFSANCQYKAEINYILVKQQINCATTTTTWDAPGLKYITADVGNEYLRSTLIVSPKIGIDGNFGPVKAGASVITDITINMDKDGVTDWKTVIKAGTELGIGKSVGPIKAEATIGSGIEIEIDPTGVTDVNIVSTAKAEIGIEAPKSTGNGTVDEQINQTVDYVNDGLGKLDTKVEIGVESRTSLMSGHAPLNGTGILSGARMSQ
jgi:tetratricopeptide (TPR) repeat protein